MKKARVRASANPRRYPPTVAYNNHVTRVELISVYQYRRHYNYGMLTDGSKTERFHWRMVETEKACGGKPSCSWALRTWYAWTISFKCGLPKSQTFPVSFTQSDVHITSNRYLPTSASQHAHINPKIQLALPFERVLQVKTVPKHGRRLVLADVKRFPLPWQRHAEGETLGCMPEAYCFTGCVCDSPAFQRQNTLWSDEGRSVPC